jgi:hypothetical protein
MMKVLMLEQQQDLMMETKLEQKRRKTCFGVVFLNFVTAEK